MTIPVDIPRYLEGGIPFAIYSFPGQREANILQHPDSLRIVPWLGRYCDGIDVAASACGPAPEPWAKSTPEDDYINATTALVQRLKKRGGKCVRMRTICGCDRKLDLNAIAGELFERFPDTFRACYFTPATGLWMLASPELLLDSSDGVMRTMALAGTRQAKAGELTWDAKNIAEQAMVTSYICERLNSLGISPQCYSTHTLHYGSIEHICTPITAQVADVESVLDSLSPTPAVAGLPVAEALADIAAMEDAPRRCYAGYVAHTDAEGNVRSYVNLRCAQFGTDSYCVYAGGGITADSIPESEWAETEAKAAAMLEIINRNAKDL